MKQDGELVVMDFEDFSTAHWATRALLNLLIKESEVEK